MMFTNDGSAPDYKIHWFDKTNGKKGANKIFTYGQGKKMAIGAFNILYPNLEIFSIEELKAV